MYGFTQLFSDFFVLAPFLQILGDAQWEAMATWKSNQTNVIHTKQKCLKDKVDMLTHLGRAAEGKLALGDAEVD